MSPDIDLMCQVGNPVKVLFDDKKWYNGVITAYKRGLFTIDYDDGDQNVRVATQRHEL